MTTVIEATVISEESVEMGKGASVMHDIKGKAAATYQSFKEAAKRVKAFIFNKETYTKKGMKNVFEAAKEKYNNLDSDRILEEGNEYINAFNKTTTVGLSMGVSSLLCIALGASSLFAYIGMYLVIYATIKAIMSKFVGTKFSITSTLCDVFVYGAMLPLALFVTAVVLPSL